MIRAAVIGIGSIGKHHARIYNELDGVELVAVADIDPNKAQRLAQQYKVTPYTDYQFMLAREEIDIVSLAVPTQLHRQAALDVIEEGTHVLVEKPIASTVEEAREIISRAKEKGSKLAVGHVERFNPAVIELKRRLEKKDLGKIFLIHARRLGPFPERVRDVGVVIDLATHDLDLMLYLTGSEVKRIHAETARRIHTDHEDLLSGLLRFADGTIGVLDINWLTPTKVRELSVTGEKGMFQVNYLTQELYFYENDYADSRWESLGVLTGVGEGNMVRLRIERKEPLRGELEAFVQAVVEGKEPSVSGEEALEALALAERVVKAGRTGKVL